MRSSARIIILFAALAFLLSGCAAPILSVPGKRSVIPSKRVPSKSVVPGTQRPYVINGRTYYPLPTSHGFQETGVASWYGDDFHGRRTANGEFYDMYGRTAAHKTLPMQTYLLVKNLENGKETIVRVNDRGPFVRDRIVDLTMTGAREIDMLANGTARVRLTALGEAISSGQGDRKIERFLPHESFDTGDFYIQIGSFADKGNADRLMDKMIARGKQTVVETYDRGDTIFYRVQVHAGDNLNGAAREEKVLSEAGFPGFVVAR